MSIRIQNVLSCVESTAQLKRPGIGQCWSKHVLYMGIMFWNFTIINCGSSCSPFLSIVFCWCGFGKPFPILHPVVVWYFKGLLWTFSVGLHACVNLGDSCIFCPAGWRCLLLEHLISFLFEGLHMSWHVLIYRFRFCYWFCLGLPAFLDYLIMET